MPRGRPRKIQGDVLIKSAEMIGWAIGGIEREILSTRERLAALSNQASALRARLPGSAKASGDDASAAASGEAPRKRRKMSADARRRISEMMTKRWAERRGTAAPGEPARKRKRRNMSPEGRKRISEAMTKRWAERRKGR